MKKLFSTVLVICILIGSCIGIDAADVTAYDEYVSVSGQVRDGVAGETVTIIVLDKDITFEKISYGTEFKDNIAFYGETKLQEDNTYSLVFSLKSGGTYYCYTGVKGKLSAEKSAFIYMSKSFFEGITGKETALELAQFMNDNIESTGIDVNIQTDRLENIAMIVFGAMGDIGNEFNTENVEKLAENIEKAEMIVALNNNEVSDINESYDSLNLSERNKKYYNKEYSSVITQSLSGVGIQSIEVFDRLLTGEIVTMEVNNGSEARIKLILNDYSELFSNTDKAGLAKALKDNAPFTDINEIVSFTQNYTENGGTGDGNIGGTSGGTGGSGGSGGAGGAGYNKYTGSDIIVNETDKKEEDVSQNDVFGDLGDVSWATEYIEEMYYSGIINGKGEGKFAPNDSITREEFAKIITLAFKLNLVDDEFPFTDVMESDWSYPYVKTAYLAGITNGISNNIFGKADRITRQDLCTMVYRAVLIGEYDLGARENKLIKDEARISDYAKDAVMTMVNAGIISGDENSNFNPQVTATRAEAAKIVCLILRNIK